MESKASPVRGKRKAVESPADEGVAKAADEVPVREPQLKRLRRQT